MHARKLLKLLAATALAVAALGATPAAQAAADYPPGPYRAAADYPPGPYRAAAGTVSPDVIGPEI